MNFLLSFMTIFYLSSCGFGIFRSIKQENAPFSIFGLLPVSFALGFGYLGIISFALMLLGFKITLPILLGVSFPWFLFALSKFKVNPMIIIQKMQKVSAFEALYILIISIAILAIFMSSVVFPIHFWDSRAIWALKAKMLFHDGTVMSQNFLDPARLNPHNPYPVFHPLSMSFLYFGMGQADDWAVMALIGLYFPMLCFFFFELCRMIFLNRERALFATALLATLPVFYFIDGPAYSGYADFPLAFYFLVSFGLILLAKKNNNTRLLVLGTMISSILPLIKNEGMVLLALNLLWIIIPEKIKIDSASIGIFVKRLLIFLSIVSIVFAIWLPMAKRLPVLPTEENYAAHLNLHDISMHLDRIPTITKFITLSFLGLEPDMMKHFFVWGGLWAILILAVIYSFKKKYAFQTQLFLVIMCYVFVMGLTYEICPGDPPMTSSFFRTMFSITPLAMLIVAGLSEKLDLTDNKKKRERI